MFVRTIPNKKTGRVYISIVHSYVDAKTKKRRAKTVKSIGFLDELEKEYKDPIAHFKEVAKQMEADRKKEIEQYNISLDFKKEIDYKDIVKKNIGYFMLGNIYEKLGFNSFMHNRKRDYKLGYDLNDIVKLLVFDRIIHPSSKKSSYENKDYYFEKNKFQIDTIYRSLDVLLKCEDKIKKHIGKKIDSLYGRDKSICFYDVTNYYFESEEITDLKRLGYGKENTKTPIIQMGLLRLTK